MLFQLFSWKKVEFGVTRRRQSHLRVKQGGCCCCFNFPVTCQVLYYFSPFCVPMFFSVLYVHFYIMYPNICISRHFSFQICYAIFPLLILIPNRSGFLLFNLKTKVTQMRICLPGSLLVVCLNSTVVKCGRHFATLVFPAIACLLVNIHLVANDRNSLLLS